MTTCDPTALLEEAKCFLCVDRKILDAYQAYLLCLKGPYSPLPEGSFYLTDESGNYVLDDQGNRIVVQI